MWFHSGASGGRRIPFFYLPHARTYKEPPRQELRHRVIAPGTPGMAPTDALERHPTTLKGPVSLNGDDGVVRARGCESARWWQEGRDQLLIGPDGEDEELSHKLHDVTPAFLRAARRLSSMAAGDAVVIP